MPTKLTIITPGRSSAGGTVRTFTKIFTSGTFMNSSTKFAISSDAIRPQTTSGRLAKSVGPGVMFSVIRTARRTAVVPDPGTPRVSMGTSAPPAAALFPASGAATPFATPVPKPALDPPMDFSIM